MYLELLCTVLQDNTLVREDTLWQETYCAVPFEYCRSDTADEQRAARFRPLEDQCESAETRASQLK